MQGETGLPKTPEQVAWVYRRVVEMAALCMVSAQAAPDKEEADSLATAFTLLQACAQHLSQQGVAEWQKIASQLLTVIMEEVKDNDRNRERDSTPGSGGNIYHTFAVSMRTLAERLRRGDD